MTTVPFHLVDVFADEPLAGNPLAVVPAADGLDEALLRRIARELNQSETTFLLAPTEPGAAARLRSFTPAGAEVSGAGHNSLGAWWWLAESGRLGPLGDGLALRQQLGGRVLPVAVEARGGRLAAIGLTQGEPQALVEHPDPAALAAALGLRGDDLLPGPRTVSTGAPHLMVHARDRAAVAAAGPDAARLLAQLRRAGAQGCYLYSLDPVDPSAAAHARFFNPTVGLWEDPATGSAAGPLAWHLASRGLAPSSGEVAIEQGHALGRPSRIAVRLADGKVELRGRCVTVAGGALHL
ncbi:PhzF family phenazine biosynthesis protein [Mycobacterium sp. KBS0706]|uniref:PhzF family phenazine biosynthesis protein n=1 Tax=Mycobacterium sp. KBS0706 TaxID=2578109 RepID=UPI00110FE5A3|nr:PhzF family phenazine biosynthesis protein [Mycobacterium sp. KBS0706]TSD84838.1 PhzF family phenazine biosynthesis protein [Mycobacterium sp. KBS0706]